MKKMILMLAAASLLFSGCSGGGPTSNTTTTTTNTSQATGGHTNTSVVATPGDAGTTTVSVSADWKEFHAPDHTFVVQMPGEPRVVSETPVLSVQSTAPTATYTVNRNTGKKMNDAEMEAHAKTASASGKMGEVKKTTLAGLPALEFDVDAGGTHSHNAMIFSDTHVYHLVVSPSGATATPGATGTPGHEAEEARKFFDSFKLEEGHGDTGGATGTPNPGATTGGDMGTPGATTGGMTDTATPGGAMTETATPGATDASPTATATP